MERSVICYTCSSTNPQKVTVTSGGTTSVSFYNKLNTGSISLTKTTEDGKNLSSWQFGIYSNSACTTLVSGPHTTNTSGKISVTGLTPGTYYVKELGHTDSTIIFRRKSSTDFLIIFSYLRKCWKGLLYQTFPAFCVSEDTPHIMAFRSLIWHWKVVKP